jgi:hypothetical protein
MRRDSWFGTAVFVFAVVFIVCGLLFIKWPDFQHKQELARIVNSRSVLDAALTIKYAKPPIYQEHYEMHNDNGISTAQYRVQGYNGKVVTITLPPDKTYAVTFFFEGIVQDGIWQLVNKPDAGDTTALYTLFIHQIADTKQGTRTVKFTDPHYWAALAGHQYEIQLSRNSPVPDLTKLKSTSLADPRYEQIVQAFRDFGPPEFRARVAQAKRLVSASSH